jgi:uracil-DNA glycosylase family 4
MKVPNQFPSLNAPYRIAVIGEAPGRDEALQGKPFVGSSGYLLNQLLDRSGIAREACFVGNVCQYQPPGNDISRFAWHGTEIQEGLQTLKDDLAKFQPNICVLLGNVPLKAAQDPSPQPLHMGSYAHPVSSWRGYLFKPTDLDSPLFGLKCLATYHPAAALRNYDYVPSIMFDLKKAKQQGTSPDLTVPTRTLLTNLTFPERIDLLQDILTRKPRIAIDIEGVVDCMSCISIADTPNHAFIVPFIGAGLTVSDELIQWRTLSRVLSDPDIHKILQNALYDCFVLQYSYNIPVRGVREDTLLKHWELYCELEKSLRFQTSIYTLEPYYKFERKTPDQDTFWRYCCKDSCVTYEISNHLDTLLSPTARAHYQFNVSLLYPILYMELKGINYSYQKAQERRRELLHQLYACQDALDTLSFRGVSDLSQQDLLNRIGSLMCYRRDTSRVKEPYKDSFVRAQNLVSSPPPYTPAQRGEISTLLELHCNVQSVKFSTYIYDTLKLPMHTNDKGALTANYEALLKLRKKLPPDSLGHKVVSEAINIRHLNTRTNMLRISADPDGRVRCAYNIVGSETGRLTCYTSPTGSGYNIQTIPTYDRDLFLPDPDHYFFQCDLSGADGWTVAAHCAALGASTMLEDYRFGIKPAKCLCYLLRHGPTSLNDKSREEILTLTNEVHKDDWDYFACKVGQHGSCYLMGPVKLANQIYLLSEGNVTLKPKDAEHLQQLFFRRYKVQVWHETIRQSLRRKNILVSASGHKRIFFAHASEILSNALAHEPQANTTYATNLAVSRLWSDPTNHTPNGLIIQPLHQVHDALCGQFHKSSLPYAQLKIPQWFSNPLQIAGINITIPYEGTYGTSWGTLNLGSL